ncbi:substrate-binding domain-containing protein [Salinisphaera sp. Q1T1-3]|uniref:substrate-binding domain-containing protein n=1 Tax=Salinisphaera sp. Q1T1-3 TaxID=2321229 RepID=UPI000E75D7EB|nr:substrate-binding domain-containing protein [Salinisphaera sp. Q1T1-3]RJS94781.1 sugar ABC transporter substrate-binding protein [Salinisphaera sp. Q1T1-3]
MNIGHLRRGLATATATALIGVLSFAAPALAQSNDKQPVFALISHAAPGDTFWDIERKGAEAAADKLGARLIYAHNPAASQQATLVDNVINQKVDGIALTLSHPDAMKSAVAKANRAGIPVIGLNSGLNEWKKTGVFAYIGQDPVVAGRAYGERLNTVGAKHVLCVNHEQGNVSLARRCEGIEKGFEGKTTILYVNGQDMTSVRSRILAKLQQDPSIDYIATLGSPFAMTSLRAVRMSGRQVEVTTFDLDERVVKAIQSGKIRWAVDQQPYLQGYLAIQSLWLKATNGNVIGGGQAVLTGPAFVTKDNVAQVAEFAARGTR